MRILTIAILAVSLSACVAPPPVNPGVDASIRGELGKASERKPVDVRAEAVEQALLPPLRMEMPIARGQPIEPRFDLSVNNAPAQQVFMSIVSGTRYSMLVHPDGKRQHLGEPEGCHRARGARLDPRALWLRLQDRGHARDRCSRPACRRASSR